MPQALGLIETKGLVGAIVAADAMLKAANVTLLGKEKVTAALITIKITGETAAVKSALEAGSAAVSRVGELVSTHLIPHPDHQLEILFPEILRVEKSETPQAKKRIGKIEQPAELKQVETEVIKPQKSKQDAKQTVKKEAVVTNPPKEKEQTLERHASLFDEDEENESVKMGSTLERLKAEALKDLRQEGVTPTKKLPEEPSETVEPDVEPEVSESSLEELEKLNVHQLRKFARGVASFPIHGREISRANRDMLLDYFRAIKK